MNTRKGFSLYWNIFLSCKCFQMTNNCCTFCLQKHFDYIVSLHSCLEHYVGILAVTPEMLNVIICTRESFDNIIISFKKYCRWGGPLSQNWLDQQLALQKKILSRMIELGMVPGMFFYNFCFFLY